jgi:5'-3' exonuclease
MGVPGFFLWLWKKYKKDNFVFCKSTLDDQELLDKVNSIDYLLIDANCLIHPMCFKILAENPEFKNQNSLENKMIQQVLDYIDYLINYVKPTKGVYLAIDGVAPVAKIKQQRYRRFKSVHDRILFDNIKEKHNKPVPKFWNNSAITPGTEFMERLHYRILAWAKTKDTEIIYSSCKTPSEGEHKLLQFIRENIKKKINYSYTMYGLDADLIFLCLSTNASNMYLLREANQMEKNKSSTELNFVSIDIMKELIKNTMEDIASVDDDSEEEMRIIEEKYTNNIINDFIFICYLLGNDFLPHLPALNIYTDGLDILLAKYVEILSENGFNKFLIERKKSGVTINNKLFIKLISYLASEETETLKNDFVSKKKHYKCSSTDPYDIEMHRIDNLMFKFDDPIQLGSDEPELWKQRYYQHNFHISDEEQEVFVDKMVEEYLRGLAWVTKYYFDRCISWTWYYPYDYPPFLEDISSYFEKHKKFNINSFEFDYGTPLRPFNQLLLVLPPQSSYLIPKELKKIVHNSKSTLAFMYPTQIKQDFIGKHKYWMAQPLLPALDINLVKHVYQKYEKKISSDVLKRNKRLDVFVINSKK